jgi:hypothetical protein
MSKVIAVSFNEEHQRIDVELEADDNEGHVMHLLLDLPNARILASGVAVQITRWEDANTTRAGVEETERVAATEPLSPGEQVARMVEESD